ncbi:MAG TPA: tetratricopeptide repeat protein [candidate division Zixibacteria bacterium]|nr:tetratricopeptide repeat protein [candidate division Zixibacteria bacterium]
MRKVFYLLLPVLLVIGCSREPKTFDQLVKAGEHAFVQGKYPKARTYLIKAVDMKPSDRNALYYLGMSYKQEYIMDSALYYLKRADLLHPKDREINLAIYPVAMELEDWENALKALSVITSTGDPIQKYYSELIKLNLKVKNPVVAYIYAKKYLALDTTDVNRYLVLADLAAQIDSVNQAIDLMQECIEKFGRHPEFLVNQGIYYASRRDYSKAEKLLREAIPLDTANAPSTRLNLANVLSKEKSRQKKLEAYNIYKDLQDEKLPAVFKLDSTVAALKAELKL